MRRREFLAGALAIAAGASKTDAQPATGMRRRLAIFSLAEPAALMVEQSENRYYRALFAELRRLGHVEGENLTVERYGRERNESGLAEVVAEVVRQNPDVVYIVGPGGLLFKRETTALPIVAMTGDPVASGLVQSLARPGANITGVSVDTGPSIYGKRIALLREIVPSMSKLAFLTFKYGTTADWVKLHDPIRGAAEAVGVNLSVIPLDLPTTEAAYREAVARAVRDGADAMMVGDSPDTMINRRLVAGLVRTTGLPAVYPFAEFVVEEGGLIAYSYDLVELNKRVANNIDAILRGKNAGDIPYYQAAKFELSINLRTAVALGVAIPASLVAVADNVVE